MSPIYTIRVESRISSPSFQKLAGILECILPVKFMQLPAVEVQCAGQILAEDATGLAEAADDTVGSTLSVPLDTARLTDGNLSNMSVAFASDPHVPFPFRGRCLTAKVSAKMKPLQLRAGERVLASMGHGPIWVLADKAAGAHFRTAIALPEMTSGASLKEVLSEKNFLAMLPLLHWLHGICADATYEGPPLRACFIFDDPNLHWPRYGFVDYEQIAGHAAKGDYHVSFATIPLDAWYTHQRTASVFRNNRERLSLVVHGNDHTTQELSRNYAPAARATLLQQAVQRVESLEKKARLPVCRVMVPPHGACSEEMLEALPKFGFEAACISHGSLLAHNARKPWSRLLGYAPSEVVQGCPILPRWGLVDNITNTILLAAFLKQPIILRGHHQDLKDGVELLDELAGFINRLGSVAWLDLTGLCRMNYQWRMEGTNCRVKPFSRSVVLQLPERATGLVIENGCWTDWQISGMNGDILTVHAGEYLPLSDSQSRIISMAATALAPVPPVKGMHRRPLPALLRRLLTEGRDRLLPLS